MKLRMEQCNVGLPIMEALRMRHHSKLPLNLLVQYFDRLLMPLAPEIIKIEAIARHTVVLDAIIVRARCARHPDIQA